MFTDESKIELVSNSRSQHVYRYTEERMDERFQRQSRAFGGGSITIWGGISLESWAELVVFRNQTVRGQVDIDRILAPIVVPEARRFGEGFVLIDDNATAHHARIIKRFLNE